MRDFLYIRDGLVQVKGELAEVQGADEQSPAIEDSLARMGYSREAEQAVNEQIKYVLHVVFVAGVATLPFAHLLCDLA